MTPLPDPFGIGRFTADALRLTGRGLDWVEAQVHEALAARQATPPALRPARHPGEPAPQPAPGARPSGPVSGADRGELGAKMRRLLSRALEQSTQSGREEVFNHVLDQLVPDEARILSALSDGSLSPVVSVHALTRAGLLGEALLEHACGVGHAANLVLPQLTPTYVGHLLSLGLVEIGPESEELKDEYQILMADSDVLAAIRKGSRGPLPARVERRTLRLSALGQALWAAAIGDEV